MVAAVSSHNGASENNTDILQNMGTKTAICSMDSNGAEPHLLHQRRGPKVKAATIGRVVDMGISDPFSLGAAMAPAAVDTIEAHFRDLKLIHLIMMLLQLAI